VKVDLRHQQILVWGGLRGALALALALAVPNSVPEKSAVINAAFAVVAFSIFAQGLTMPWLVRVLGLTRKIEPVA
jgi:CPA1 family monovalent cation:H+ antiporter